MCHCQRQVTHPQPDADGHPPSASTSITEISDVISETTFQASDLTPGNPQASQPRCLRGRGKDVQAMNPDVTFKHGLHSLVCKLHRSKRLCNSSGVVCTRESMKPSLTFSVDGTSRQANVSTFTIVGTDSNHQPGGGEQSSPSTT